jgi:ribosomal protein S4E
LLTLFIPISFFKQQYKLCKVKAKRLGDKGVPCVNLHDGRTIRYPDPQIGAMDTIKLDLETGKVRRGPTLHQDCPAARPPLFSP